MAFLVLALMGHSVRAAESPAPKPGGIEFNRDIRPILSDNCFFCHGPDSAARKKDLRLDRREDAIKAGAIVPKDTIKSKLIERIFTTDPDDMMPPPSSKRHITDAQRELLKKWIEQGAEYQLHWAFIAPARPLLPLTAAGPNAIDDLVSAGLAPDVT